MKQTSMVRRDDKEIIFVCGAVVVAQLAERSPPTPEICRSNPIIGKTLFDFQLYFKSVKMKINGKEAVNGSFFLS